MRKKKKVVKGWIRIWRNHLLKEYCNLDLTARDLRVFFKRKEALYHCPKTGKVVPVKISY
jgi:hypothetical protein